MRWRATQYLRSVHTDLEARFRKCADSKMTHRLRFFLERNQFPCKNPSLRHHIDSAGVNILDSLLEATATNYCQMLPLALSANESNRFVL
jgi:hypothetical protein